MDLALAWSSPVFFSSGIFGERLPLRYYLSAGMVLSGLFTSLFGLGYFWDIHMLWYFVLIQVRACYTWAFVPPQREVPLDP